MISTGRILVTVVKLCNEAKDWERLKENINLLSRRRGQLKQAVVKMVQEVCTYIDNLPTRDLQYELIETLRSVTEGKVSIHKIIKILLLQTIVCSFHCLLLTVFMSFLHIYNL